MIIEAKKSGSSCNLPEESKKIPSAVWIILSQVNPPVSEEEKNLIQTLACLTEPDFSTKTLEEVREVLKDAQTKAEKLSEEPFYQQEPAKIWRGHLEGFTGALNDIFLLKLSGKGGLFEMDFSVLNERTRDFLALRTGVDCREGKILVFENESEDPILY